VTVAVEERNHALLGWYDRNRRDLPWRSTSDPYPILVSEVMSQQTQMSRVVPRFERFMERWPTVEDLARAQNDEVLEEWSGLGYNSRALRLRDAAIAIAADGWPSDPLGLRSLPGIGPYTANAIASMAFGHKVAAVDTNLRRVISRWIGTPLDDRDLLDAAAGLVDEDAGSWNQAVMDLGAELCRPVNPDCGRCPVSACCEDPTIYEAPPKQAPFEGSNRQLRGALVLAHLQDGDLHETGEALGRTPEDIKATIAELEAEGLLTPK